MTTLFDPITVGRLDLPNRLFMAPMTRSRATDTGLVGPLNAEYYAQRSGAGLIISEGIQPSEIGQGYINTPGLHSAEQVEAWRTVTDAVHAKRGHIFAQLMHSGRIGHSQLYPGGALPLAPSAIASGEKFFNGSELLDCPEPQEMTTADIEQAIADFASAAQNAIDAGFDGVELHGANGYLIHQFLADNTNRRSDEYGGSIEGRTRFALAVVDRVVDAIGADRIGIRFSPGNPFNGIVEADPGPLYLDLVEKVGQRGLAYLHLVEEGNRELVTQLRALWPGTFVLNPHPTAQYPATPETATEAIESGVADAVALGTTWLANPDLDARIKAGGPFNEPNPDTFYGGDHTGYTDYPVLVG